MICKYSDWLLGVRIYPHQWHHRKYEIFTILGYHQSQHSEFCDSQYTANRGDQTFQAFRAIVFFAVGGEVCFLLTCINCNRHRLNLHTATQNLSRHSFTGRMLLVARFLHVGGLVCRHVTCMRGCLNAVWCVVTRCSGENWGGHDGRIQQWEHETHR